MDDTKLDDGWLDILEGKYNYTTRAEIGTFGVFYYVNIMFDREGNVFPYARLSENTINFVHGGYLKILRRDLEILVLKFKKSKEMNSQN